MHEGQNVECTFKSVFARPGGLYILLSPPSISLTFYVTLLSIQWLSVLWNKCPS